MWAWSNICKLCFGHLALGGNFGAALETKMAGRHAQARAITLLAGLYLGSLHKRPSWKGFQKLFIISGFR